MSRPLATLLGLSLLAGCLSGSGEGPSPPRPSEEALEEPQVTTTSASSPEDPTPGDPEVPGMAETPNRPPADEPAPPGPHPDPPAGAEDASEAPDDVGAEPSARPPAHLLVEEEQILLTPPPARAVPVDPDYRMVSFFVRFSPVTPTGTSPTLAKVPFSPGASRDVMVVLSSPDGSQSLSCKPEANPMRTDELCSQVVFEPQPGEWTLTYLGTGALKAIVQATES